MGPDLQIHTGHKRQSCKPALQDLKERGRVGSSLLGLLMVLESKRDVERVAGLDTNEV